MPTSTTVDVQPTGQQVNKEELALVRRVAAGDQEALSELYNRYIDAVYRFVYHQVGGQHHDAEDVTQETFIAAIKNLESFRGDSRLYVWLCGIARHKASDLRRRRDHAKRPRPTDDDESLHLHGGSRELTLEEMAERETLRRRVWQALLALPEHYQQVLTLKYMEEFKVSEIALILGKSEKAVESLLVRARDEFKVQLDLDTGFQ